MGIIKYFRKKYWEAAIFRGGRRIPFTCDGLTAVPDSAYALFTEKELEKIYEERDIFHHMYIRVLYITYDIVPALSLCISRMNTRKGAVGK